MGTTNKLTDYTAASQELGNARWAFEQVETLICGDDWTPELDTLAAEANTALRKYHQAIRAAASANNQ